MNNTDQLARWIRVSRSEPCQVCGKPDYCTRSADGELLKCCRVPSERELIQSDGSAAWLHKPDSPLTPVSLPKKDPPPRVTTQEWLSRARSMFEHRLASVLRQKLATSLGVSQDSLYRLRVGYGVDRDGTPFASFPCRDPRGNITGIWKRYADGSKKSVWGSRLGLFYAYPFQSHRVICVVEGPSDTAACISKNIPCVGRTSNLGGIALLEVMLKDIDVILFVGENDYRKEDRCQHDTGFCNLCWPGKYGAQKSAQLLSKRLHRKCYWAMVDGSKDSREWLRDHSPEQFLPSLKKTASRAQA